MEIVALNAIPFNELHECFVKAFENYFVKFEISEVQLAEKWRLAKADYGLSFGAVVKGKLVGFIVHGVKEINGLRHAYNGGTGVLPEFRGQQITKQIYEFALPQLKAANIEIVVLEVIKENLKALHIYESLGFRIQRSLHNYTGAVEAKVANKDPSINFESIEPTPAMVPNFFDIDPAWEGDFQSMSLAGQQIKRVGMTKDGQLLAYAIFNPTSGSIIQFAVDKSLRRMGYGKMLLNHLTTYSSKLSAKNVDDRSKPTIAFIKSAGMKNTINQYEMKLKLSL